MEFPTGCRAMRPSGGGQRMLRANPYLPFMLIISTIQTATAISPLRMTMPQFKLPISER